MLKRLQVPILNVPSVNKIRELFPEIRRVADRVGRPERGTELVQTLEAQYKSFAVDRVRGTGAIYLSGGYILGKDTIVNDVMQTAGLSNVGASIGVRGEDRLALETLILSPPDFLILDLSRPERPSLGRRMLKHPAVAKMPVAHEVLELPVQYWLCSTPATIEGAAQLTARVTAQLSASKGRHTP
jgi:iron complex transport system substrate-binding protein